MIEAVIVLSVIGIVVAASVGRIRGAVAQQEIDGWVRAMAKEVAGARQTAMARRQVVQVSVGSTSYTILTASGTLYVGAVPAGTTLTTTCAGSICYFNKRGLPTLVDTVTMAPDSTITVTSALAGRTYIVEIETGTGRVTYSGP